MYAHRGFSPFVWFVTLKDDLDALFCLAFLSHMYLNLFKPGRDDPLFAKVDKSPSPLQPRAWVAGKAQ